MDNTELMEEYSASLSQLNRKRKERDSLKSLINVGKKELSLTNAKIYGLYYELSKYRDDSVQNKEIIDDIKMIKLLDKREKIDTKLKMVQDKINFSEKPADEIPFTIVPDSKTANYARKLHFISLGTFGLPLSAAAVAVATSLFPVAVGCLAVSAISLPISIAAKYYSKPLQTTCDDAKKTFMVRRAKINKKINKRMQKQSKFEMPVRVSETAEPNNVIIKGLLEDIKVKKAQKKEVTTRMQELKEELSVCKMDIEILESKCTNLEQKLIIDSPKNAYTYIEKDRTLYL